MIKDFLKPTKKRILLAVALFVVILFALDFIVFRCFMSATKVCTSLLTELFIRGSNLGLFPVLLFVAVFVVSYIISCFVFKK